MDYFVLRVSTQERKKNGEKDKDKTQQEFDRQIFVFKSRGYVLTPDNMVEDRISGGLDFEQRPNFMALVEKLQPNDNVYFCEITRFSRNYTDGMRLIDFLLFNKKVNIIFVSENRTLFAGKRFNKDEWLFISMQLLWAEYRKREIGDYTSQALQAKRQNGQILGRPKLISTDKYDRVVELYELGNTMEQVASMTGMSRATVSRILAKRKKDKENL